MTGERATASVGAELGGIVVPAAGVRALAGVMVALALASPWLASWTGLLTRSAGEVEAATREVVQLRPELVLLPGGVFTMGSPYGQTDGPARLVRPDAAGRDLASPAGRQVDESPHEVRVSPFYMCRTEVTHAQWREVMGSSPSNCAYGCRDEHPVQNVSWEMTVAYLNRLTDRENDLRAPDERLSRCYWGPSNTTWAPGCTGYRLPTEAEWEYAARAGTSTAYSFGDDPAVLGEHAAFYDNSRDGVTPVGQKLPNPWGLFDVHGNVSEWVWDWYESKIYPRGTEVLIDPRGPTSGEYRVLRGGSFWREAAWLRSAYRAKGKPGDADFGLGLRCARSALGVATVPVQPEHVPASPEPAAPESAPEGETTGTDANGGGARRLAPRRRPERQPIDVLTVRLASSVTSTLRRDIVQEIARSRIMELTSCFPKFLPEDLEVGGSVTLTYMIDRAGQVPTAVVKESTLKGPSAGVCMAQVVRKWVFAAPEDGEPVIVQQEFVFERGIE